MPAPYGAGILHDGKEENNLRSVGDQALAGHLGGLRDVQNLQHSGGQIRQAAALAQRAGMSYHTQRNRIGGVGGKRGAVLVKHAFGTVTISGLFFGM